MARFICTCRLLPVPVRLPLFRGRRVYLRPVLSVPPGGSLVVYPFPFHLAERFPAGSVIASPPTSPAAK